MNTDIRREYRPVVHNYLLQEMIYGEPVASTRPEPSYDDVPVGGVLEDRDGTPWTRTALGWCAIGDHRPQPWEKVKQWFSC